VSEGKKRFVLYKYYL